MSRARVKRILSAFPAATLQHLGLLIAFVLLVAAHGFAAAHPALASILIFVFSLPYLVASLVTKRANFLYATMLLGAVSYFLACHALGAPASTFPLLSVPLVVCLELIGQYLRKRLGKELANYPPTVFRAMNITVAVFSFWALAQAAGLIGQGGLISCVAGFAFLDYAALYLGHCLARSHAVYTYTFAVFLSLGGILTVGALVGADYCWLPTIAATALLLLLGTKLHGRRKYVWSRHFYFSAAAVLFVSLCFAALRWTFLLLDLALASLLLWVGYGWLVRAVGEVRRATMAERVVAKYLFSAALLLVVPVIVVLFIKPTDAYVVCSALLCGLTLSWIAWQRRSQTSSWASVYLLGAVMFVSGALLGMAGQLSGWLAAGWSLAGAVVLLIAMALLAGATDETTRRRLGTAAIFPAFFAWYVPMLQGQLGLALGAAGAALAAVLVVGAYLKETYFYCALGPTLAGTLTGAVLLLAGPGQAAWIACVVAAAAAAAGFVWAGGAKRPVIRVAANLAWLVLSVAAVVIAAVADSGHLLYCITAVTLASVLAGAWDKRKEYSDVLNNLMHAVAVLGTIGAVLVGPLSGQSNVLTGLCLLVLSVARWLAWGRSRGVWNVRTANGLFALGSLLVILAAFSNAEAQLGVAAGVVLILFAVGAALRGRFVQASNSAVLTGHLSSIALACTALILAWEVSTWGMALVVLGYAAIYALMPRLRQNSGFRLGAGLWLSLAILLGLAVYSGTPYREQLPQLAVLSLIWMAAGYILKRLQSESRAMPLYICAAILAGFCGLLSLFGPATEDSWLVFLVNGIVFACLFLLLRQDIFAYLITLALSLMAYDWVKASTSSFTQDILFYLVIGAAVLGLFFLLPHVKRLVIRLGSMPMISIFTWRGAAIICMPIALLALLVLSTYSVKLSGHPRFCTSCHYMGDYYTSWQHSSHKDVACIDCHYEPGMTATVKGKLEGMVQLVKYVSHSYGTKPHALISNESCMRSGCHEEMDHSKETLLFRGQIRFRHDKHLDEHPRGKELNCVSCHGQTVEGEHISVGETTCLTCHFYGRKQESVATGECLTCHVQPEKTVSFMGQPFNHREFLAGKDKVHCSYCHSQVTQGDGAISSTRCRSCHRHSLEKIEDQAQFHLVHVSKGHFDCLQCHDEIKHGIHPMEQQLLASGNCHTCHEGERHSLQERIYAGTALPEVERIPDAMYKAGVACDGCHTQVQSAGLGGVPFTKKLSGPKQCADCHGSEMYGQMLASWQEDTKERLGELQPALKQLDQTCRTAQVSAEELDKAQKLLNSAKTKLSYVMEDGSYGAHNIVYVSAILDSVETEIESCRSLTATWNRPGPEESRQ